MNIDLTELFKDENKNKLILVISGDGIDESNSFIRFLDALLSNELQVNLCGANKFHRILAFFNNILF